MLRYPGLLIFGLLWAFPAGAQQTPVPPQGSQVYNQATIGRLLTKSNSVRITPTKGIYIGDATACDAAVLFAGDTVAVTLSNLASGQAYPFSIQKLMSTSTTCTVVIALY